MKLAERFRPIIIVSLVEVLLNQNLNTNSTKNSQNN